VSFPEVTKYFDGKRVVVTGYPVRARFFQTERGEARRAFHLEPEQQAVTVLGGSRGAHHINQAVVARLCDLARATQLVHITGTEDEAWVKAEVQRLPDELRGRVRVFGYLDEDLPDALAAADVIVARAGAAVLGEFPALGVPAILVPYPFAGRHQEMNCRYLADRGAAICVQDALVTQDLVKEIKALLDEPRRLEHMRDASRSLAQPDAARRLATLVRTVAREGV
jgi:UDP-N-acetylglucosamine--N-acetylmuramyl-(pentapeptide) pyrophosphoryl-undecaprenol N-acetylglucosamine transferase